MPVGHHPDSLSTAGRLSTLSHDRLCLQVHGCVSAMSKHRIEEAGNREFWKKMKYGAMTAITIGSGIFAATTVLNKRSVISGIAEGVRATIQSTPSNDNGATQGSCQVSTHNQQSDQMLDEMQRSDREEARAVIEMQLQFAMQRQDIRRVQQLSRQLDVLDEYDTQHGCNGNLSTGTVSNHPDRTNATSASMQDDIVHDVMTSTRLSTSPPVRQLRNRPMQPSMHSLMPNSGHEPVNGKTKKTSTPVAVTHNESCPRQVATAKFKVGDVIEALDPTTGLWCPATIHAIAKNGLVQVRWFDPGHDERGRSFHPVGEVWADQVRVNCHKPVSNTFCGKVTGTVFNGDGGNEDIASKPPDGLQVGDDCYAVGKVIENKWFCAKLLGIRSRSPPLRVEYIATLDGQATELVLPSPRKDYIRVDQLRRNRPKVDDEPDNDVKPEDTALEVTRYSNDNDETVVQGGTKAVNDADMAKVGTKERVDAASTNQKKTEKGGNDDQVVITPDLRCTICKRPDDEANMLVCDCKVGYHIYCLKPPLEKVPEGDWLCPSCMKSAH